MSKKNRGITETCWTNETPEFKLCWNFFSKSFAGLLSLFIVTKTGCTWIDCIVWACATWIPLLIISGQRDLGRYKPRWRKAITRACVVSTLNSVTLLGLVVYLAVLFPLFRETVMALPSVLIDLPPPTFAAGRVQPGTEILAIVRAVQLGMSGGVVICSLCFASFKIFRDLRFEELIRTLPKQGLLRFLARRQFIASDRPSFIVFELTVVVMSMMFSSMMVAAARIALAH